VVRDASSELQQGAIHSSGWEAKVFLLEGDSTSLEAAALELLAADGELSAYRHDRFWQCMDTLRDVRLLERLWQSGNPPWKVWE